MIHKFVEYIPEDLEDGVLYVSIAYATVVHKCCCGCGNEVVTPLSPTDWKLTYDGRSISLYPSIGNWSLACGSHYLIKNNEVIWAGQWSDRRIAAGRLLESLEKQEYYRESYVDPGQEESGNEETDGSNIVVLL